MPRPLRVLIVEDDLNDAELIVRELCRAGFAPEWHRVDTEEAYVASLRPDLDIILSDYSMPQFSGLRALEVLGERGLEIPFVIVSGTIGEDTAVEAMMHGATDFLLKDRMGRLGPAIERALEQGRSRRERQRALHALRESEDRFRQLAENIRDVFWVSDIATGQVLYASPAYEEIWGRRRAELYELPQSWFDAVHPEDRAQVFNSVATGEKGGIYDAEYRVIRADGSVRWVRDTAFPVVSPSGEVNRVVGVARDITERKVAENVIRESERRFREMLENVELITMTLDREGRVTFCNDHLLKLTGRTRDEVIGVDWFSNFIPSDLEVKELFLGMVKDGQIPAHYENPIKTKTGELRDIVWNNTILRDATGAFVGTASIGEDVTERKRAEERIREQAAMLDQAHEAIIVCGIRTFAITFWNHGAERLYGWTAGEALGRHIGALVFVDPTIPESATKQLLHTGEWCGECKQLTKAGKSLTVSGHATLVSDADGNPKSALIINIDVTEQKALEARFLRAQRMESIGTLASGVAHDLNNILSPIMMSVPLLRCNISDAMRDEIVSTIEISAERGAQIVKQVLTFGRGVEGERHPLKVEVLINEVIKIASETFPKNIEIESSIGSDLWLVLGDATQLHQVLLNLCVNARDAMPAGGILRIRATNLEVDASYASMLSDAVPGPCVLLEIADSGTGISPEDLERIFEPFFTTKEVGKGTGLGLSTVLGIVKSHGGFTNVNTWTGGGSAFQVYLPATTDRMATPDEAPCEPPPRGNGELVLVVDDEPSVLAAARLALEAGGYQVLLACDGTEAVGVYALHSERISVVLTDLMMPVMDGIALIRAIRSLAPNLVIIASTGLGEKAQGANLKDMNVEWVLNKPYSADTLLRTIRNALHSSGARIGK